MARSVKGRFPVVSFDNMMAGSLERGGIEPAFLDGELSDRFRDAFDAVEARASEGSSAFRDLPRDRALAKRTLKLAEALKGRFNDVVVVGIGGSALGTVALRDALLAPAWNELGDRERRGRPRLHLMDNPDPDTVSSLLGRLDPGRTLFNVVSKSGATAETMALFLVVWDRLVGTLGPGRARDHVVVTTDARRGALREVAASRHLRSLPVPEGVGGRFSVLSPVGMLPAALAGIDTEAVLAGADACSQRCASAELRKNPAGALATLLHSADVNMGAPIQVFMPYADRLRGFAYWVQQLWAESLAKAVGTDGAPAATGPTPLPAFGAADQHSILQLLMEGPEDKVVVFLRCRAVERDLAIPGGFAETPALSYLAGHSLFGLLEHERRATAEALRRAGRMSLTVTVERIEERTIGALFMLFQMSVVYAGALYGVDPFDQPGVELGKSLTCGLMGRSGYREPDIPAPDPRWRTQARALG